LVILTRQVAVVGKGVAEDVEAVPVVLLVMVMVLMVMLVPALVSTVPVVVVVVVMPLSGRVVTLSWRVVPCPEPLRPSRLHATNCTRSIKMRE
jgi:hypothetical protein